MRVEGTDSLDKAVLEKILRSRAGEKPRSQRLKCQRGEEEAHVKKHKKRRSRILERATLQNGLDQQGSKGERTKFSRNSN